MREARMATATGRAAGRRGRGAPVAGRAAPARRLALRIGVPVVGWIVSIGGVLLFGLHPGVAVAGMLLASSPTIFAAGD